jgi:flagellar biosynthetic protein FliQ
VVAAGVGFLSAVFQAATQVQDAALGHFPKFVAVTLALALVGPWMGRQVLAFAVLAFGGH